MVDLSKNEYQGDPSPEVASALSGAELRFYLRTSNLRERIAKGLSVDPEWVRLGNGAEELLVELFQSLVRLPKKERKVVVPDFTWPFYDQYIADAEATKVEFPLTADLAYDTNTVIESLKAENPRMTVLCSPNNPTSSIVSPEALGSILQNTGGIVVLDQTYLGFDEEMDYVPLLCKHKNFIIIRSFSKFYGLAGARIGFALIHPETGIALGLPHKMLGLSILIEKLGIAALDSQAYYRTQARRISEERDAIIKALNKTGAFLASSSKTNFVFFRGSVQDVTLFDKKLLEQGIKVYVFPEGKYKGYARFGIGRTTETRLIIDTLQNFQALS